MIIMIKYIWIGKVKNIYIYIIGSNWEENDERDERRDLAAELEEDTKRRQKDGDEDVDAV